MSFDAEGVDDRCGGNVVHSVLLHGSSMLPG
jgi:hypothetical protein